MRVSILYKHLPHYRVDFFNGLHATLTERHIDLDLLYGKSPSVPKRDEVDLDWARPVPNRIYGWGGWSLCWEQVPDDIYQSDLIVLMQENRVVSNHVLQVRAKARHRKIAFWDHGLNLQAPPLSVGNIIKKMYTGSAFWWFAYTESVKKWLVGTGFPPDHITVVQNAIDTTFLRNQSAQVDDGTLSRLRASLGIGLGPIGLFCGGMYKEKRLPFLLKACEGIRKAVPGFEMIFIGDGTHSHLVAEAARDLPWIHYIGPMFGANVVPYMKLADVFLMPGLVGLAVLDAFAMEKPFITTDYPYHSPEIEYLVNGENGIMTRNSIKAFVAGVVEVLSSVDLQRRIRQGCQKAAMTYTVEQMVQNYAAGIEQALAAN